MRPPDLSRRAILGAMALTPIAGAAGALPTASATSPGRAAWDRAMNAYVAAAQASDDAYTAVADADVRWVALKVPASTDAGVFYPTDTVETYNGRQDAIRLRQREAEEAARAQSGIDAAEDVASEKWEAAQAAKWTLIHMPAPDAAALRWKLDKLLNDDGGDWSAKVLDAIYSDVDRLCGEGEA